MNIYDMKFYISIKSQFQFYGICRICRLIFIQVRNVVTRVVQALVRAQMGLVSAVHVSICNRFEFRRVDCKID